MIFKFEDYSLDVARQELRRGPDLIAVEPQVLDLLQYLICNRERVVTKDDMIATIWKGRIVSESTLTSRITIARQTIGDSGGQQRLIRTIPRKGLRFIGDVREEHLPALPNVSAQETREGQIAPPPSVEMDRPERRQLTILACDPTGSAAISARLDPEDLRDVMSACLDCVKRVAARFDGFLAQSMPDGALIYFGYPQAHEDDAERAIRAGLALTEDISELKLDILPTPLRPRVSVATGLVVIGDAADGGHSAERTIAGDTPHLAMRLLANADPGAVMIAASTRRLVGNLFEYGDAEILELKGADPVETSRVWGESAVESRFDALRSAQTRLVGRGEELDLLRRRWHQAGSGEGRVVLITGEAGIGKSRLAIAIQDAIRDERQATLRFYCSPHRTQTALYPVIRHIEHAARFDARDSDGTKLQKLERLLRPLSSEPRQDLALFAELLSIPAQDRYAALSLSPRRRKELLLERVTSRITSLATKQPILVILEDVHWIDPTTRELFDTFIDRVRDLPVLFVVTCRPECAPPWIGQSHVTVLTLNRLDRHENAEMVRRIAGDKDFPPALLQQIVTQTDGVPLFIEELTKSVLESDILREEAGAYVLAGTKPALAVPATLQASLAARFDRLAPVRSVMQTGAALGREFSYAVLRAVTGLDDAELAPLLSQLVASGLVYQRGVAPHSQYVFKHALVQDAAHETLLKSQRAQLHGRIVDVLEREFPDTPLNNPDVLAYHCGEAGLTEKAIDYRLKATRTALDRSASIEAQAQVETGIRLLPAVRDESVRRQLDGRLQAALGNTFSMTKGFASPDVAATLSRACGLLDEARYPIESLGALCGLFNYHMIRSESPKGLKLVEPYLKRSLNPPTAAVIQFLLGAAHVHMGNFREASFHLENSLSHYDEDSCRPIAFINGYHIRSFALIWLGFSYLYTGSFGRAKETISAAVRDARLRSHPFTLVSAMLALARFHSYMRNFEGAIAATEEGFAIANEQRSPYHVSRANVLRAVNLIEANRFEAGINLMEQALTAHRGTGANYQSSYNLSYLALAHAKYGNFKHALELADQAIDEVERTGERWWQAEALRIKGEVLLTGAPARCAEAEDCFQTALTCAQRQGARFWQLRAAQSMARLWFKEQRPAEAQRALEAVYETLTDGFELPDLIEARALLAEIEKTTAPSVSVPS